PAPAGRGGAGESQDGSLRAEPRGEWILPFRSLAGRSAARARGESGSCGRKGRTGSRGDAFHPRYERIDDRVAVGSGRSAASPAGSTGAGGGGAGSRTVYRSASAARLDRVERPA